MVKDTPPCVFKDWNDFQIGSYANCILGAFVSITGAQYEMLYAVTL